MSETDYLSLGRGRHVVVVGAGLAGSLQAVYLAKMGFKVDLYEMRPDPREKGVISGRSINLALSCRGLTALDGVGLKEKVLADAIPMPGRILHSQSAKAPTTFQAYSKV